MIKVGIIGAGGIAQMAHIPNYQKMKEVEVVAICDSNEKKVRTVAKKFGIKTYFTDYKNLLELKEIEAVSICTSNCFHQEQVITSLKRGKHVLCEKPLCLNAKGVEEIFKEVERSKDKICMVAYMQRFMNVSQVLKEFIDNDELGEIYYAKVSYLRRRGIPAPGSWFTSKKMSGGGPLIDLGVHILDLSLWLMGNPLPVSVTGSVYAKFKNEATSGGWPPSHTLMGNELSYGFDVEDLASGFIKFSNGASLFLEVSWAGNSEEGERFSFFGTKGGARIEFSEDTSSYEKLKIFKGGQGRLFDIVPVLSQENDPYYEEVQHFIECIKEGKKPIVTPAEALNVARIIDAIYKSAEEKREVMIPLGRKKCSI